MNGTAALSGALRQCSDVCYAVPGYPVTKLIQATGAEIVINEKVALEYALGESIAGRRAAVIVKNVGMNACTDPLVNATTQGLCAGVIIIAGDDVLAYGSQNMQDSRYFGELAQVPVLEPDSETCVPAIEAAFEVSEQFSRIAIVRVIPQLLEGDVAAMSCSRNDSRGQLANPGLTMRGRSRAAEQKVTDMFSWSTSSPLNRAGKGGVGVGMAGGASRVVTVYPPPGGIFSFNNVNEIGRTFFRNHRCIGLQEETAEPETYAKRGHSRTFCRGCPFLPLLRMLREKSIAVITDIGCSVLAMNPPFRIGKACYALGSSVAVAARSTTVALTGDYALLHSGINALIDIFEKNLPLLCIVLKNDRMGMTGGQKTFDLIRYLAWADPVICPADNLAELEDRLVVTDMPRVLVVEGACPEGCSYETVEY